MCFGDGGACADPGICCPFRSFFVSWSGAHRDLHRVGRQQRQMCIGDRVDSTYAERAKQMQGHCVVGGSNYGQGSSREHAALGPQYLGLRAVLTKGFARIHAQNLINFGVLPLTFINLDDYDSIQADDVLRLTDLRRVLTEGGELFVENVTRQRKFQMRHDMSPRQVQFLLRGGLINWMKERLSEQHKN